jgi:hypothetical protein
VGERTFQQQSFQLLALPGRQLGLPTGMRFGFQTFPPRSLRDLLPSGNSPRRDAESPSYLAGTVTGFEQREGLKALTFELFGFSWGSHA